MNHLLETYCPHLFIAYIDPGSGSAIFQILIAGIVGAGWTLKCYWRSIMNRFSKPKDGTTRPDAPSGK